MLSWSHLCFERSHEQQSCQSAAARGSIRTPAGGTGCETGCGGSSVLPHQELVLHPSVCSGPSRHVSGRQGCSSDAACLVPIFAFW